MLPDILNYIPDPKNGRPIADGQVYFFKGGYLPPTNAKDIDPAFIAPVTYTGQAGEITVPQPMFTSKGGVIKVSSEINLPLLNVDPLTELVAIYDKCGSLVYRVGYRPGGQFAIISETAPQFNLTQGVRWYKPSEAATYVYYCDGDGCQWVQEPVANAESAVINLLSGAESDVLIAGVMAKDLARKFNEYVFFEDFGAVGDDIDDDTAAINSALATGKNCYGSINKTYKVTGKLFCTSNQLVDLKGSAIKQHSNQTPIFDVQNKSGVSITGGKLIGKGEPSYVNSPSSLAVGVLAGNAVDLKVYNMEFVGFYYSPLMVTNGGEGVYFFNNKVIGIPLVLAADSNYRNTTGATFLGKGFWCLNNDISGVATGVIVGQQSEDVFVSDNTIHDTVNEHGIYLDTAIKRAKVTKNTIVNTGVNGNGIKVQIYDDIADDCIDVSIVDNTVRNCGLQGILSINTSISPIREIVGLHIKDNTVINSGSDGISIRNSGDVDCSDNIVLNPNGYGISYGSCRNLDIDFNKIRGSGLSGIRDLSPSNGVSIFRNRINDPARLESSPENNGVQLATSTPDLIVERNIIKDSFSRMRYGVFTEADINSELSLIDNEVFGATDYGCRFFSTTAMKQYSGNKWQGAIGPSFNGPSLQTIASAPTIAPPRFYDVFKVSGSATIDNVEAAGNANREITIIFTGTLTLSIAGNVRLSSGAFSATPDSSIKLTCDGTFWYG